MALSAASASSAPGSAGTDPADAIGEALNVVGSISTAPGVSDKMERTRCAEVPADEVQVYKVSRPGELATRYALREDGSPLVPEHDEEVIGESLQR